MTVDVNQIHLIGTYIPDSLALKPYRPPTCDITITVDIGKTIRLCVVITPLVRNALDVAPPGQRLLIRGRLGMLDGHLVVVAEAITPLAS